MADDSTTDQRPLIARARAQVESAAASGAEAAAAPEIPGYADLREIQRGAQGVVYRAVQVATGRDVAIKVLRESAIAGAAARARFEREIRILARLRHPGIVTVHDGGVAGGSPYCVMDYVPGRDLETLLADHPLPARDALRLFASIADAVAAAHQRGVIHRDLKPGNVRVDESGEPRILDFGIARTLADDACAGGPATSTGQFLGSLPWASPEQAAGRADDVDVRSDVYSLGVILFQMLTGRFPYPVGGPLRTVLEHIEHTPPAPLGRAPGISADVETIVATCLAKDRARRYQSAAELAADVRRHLGGEPILARRRGAIELLAHAARRHWPIALGTAAILALVIAFAVHSAIRSAQLASAYAESRMTSDHLARLVQRMDAIQDARALRDVAAAWEAGALDDAAQQLGAIVPDRRGWTWRHLRWLAARRVWSADGGSSPVTAIAWSADGRRFASGTWSGTIRVHEPARGNVELELTDALGDVRALAFHPRGDRLAAAGSGGVAVVDLRAGAIERTFGAEVTGLEHVAFIGDDATGAVDLVLAATADGRAHLWRGLTGAPVAHFVCRHDERAGADLSGVGALAIDARGGRIATAAAGASGIVRVWDAQTGAMRAQVAVATPAELRALAFSSDGRRLAVSVLPKSPGPAPAAAGFVEVFDLAAPGAPAAALAGATTSVTALAFVSGDRRVAGGDWSGTVHIWDAADGGLVMSVPAHRSAVREIAAPPQGDVLVSSAGTARAWHVPCDLRRAAPADPPTAANEGRATSASARGGAVASASATVEDGVVRVRDGDVIRLTLPAPPGESVTAVLLLGSGRELVTGGSEGTIRVWDAMHGELRAELRGHRAPVARLSIDDSEGRLVSADASGIVRLWPAPRDEGVMDDLERAEPEPERP